jgi:hypothetical protein
VKWIRENATGHSGEAFMSKRDGSYAADPGWLGAILTGGFYSLVGTGLAWLVVPRPWLFATLPVGYIVTAVLVMTLMGPRELWIEDGLVCQRTRGRTERHPVMAIGLINCDYLPHVGPQVNMDFTDGGAFSAISIDRGTESFRRALGGALSAAGLRGTVTNERARAALYL